MECGRDSRRSAALSIPGASVITGFAQHKRIAESDVGPVGAAGGRELTKGAQARRRGQHGDGVAACEPGGVRITASACRNWRFRRRCNQDMKRQGGKRARRRDQQTFALDEGGVRLQQCLIFDPVL
jgi:hypothetical protein